MGGIFDRLTKSGVESGGNTTYYDSPGAVGKGVASASAVQAQPSVATMGDVSIPQPPPQTETPGGGVSDIPQPTASPSIQYNTPAPTSVPKVVKPNFSDIAADSSGNITPGFKGLTKLGALTKVLLAGAQGGIDAAAGGALDAPRDGRSPFGTGMRAAQQMPIYRSQVTRENRRADLQDQALESQAKVAPVLQQLGIMKTKGEIANTAAQTKLYDIQALAKETPSDKVLNAYPGDDGKQHIVTQNAKGAIQDRVFGDVKEKDANTIDGAALKEMTRLNNGNPPTLKQLGDYQKTKAQNTHISMINPLGGTAPLAPNASGDAVLSAIPQQYRELVKGIANYEMDPSKTTSMRTGERAQVLSWVKQYDPSFDMSQYPSRQKFRQDMTSGNYAKSVRSLNTAVAHLQNLSDTADKLDNGSWHIFNTIGNWSAQERGKPEVNNFKTAANAVESEMANVFKGTGATDQEIKAWRERLDTSQSPAELHGAINQLLELMSGRLGALADQYKGSMGKPRDFHLLSDKSAKILRKLGGDSLLQEDSLGGVGGAMPTQGSSAANPHSDIGFVPITN